MREVTLTALLVTTIVATIEAPITVGNAKSNNLQEVGSVVAEETTIAEVTTVVVTDDD
jgi:hypothetical protein